MLEKVKCILSQYTEMTEITEESSLTADLGLSSFDLVSIVTDFEDQFEIEISDRDIKNFVCVNDILDYLKTHT